MEQEEEGDPQLLPMDLGCVKKPGSVGGKPYSDINPIIFIATKYQRFSGVVHFHLQSCFTALL